MWGPINLVLDPKVTCVEFALYVEKTGQWINAADGGDFQIVLDSAPSQQQPSRPALPPQTSTDCISSQSRKVVATCE